MTALLQIFAAFIGTLGFAYMFNIHGKKLLLAALGGLLSWSLFLLLGLAIDEEVTRYFIVSILITLYSEILARLIKTPATTFCIISLIPLVPGGALYYTMAYALSGNSQNFVEKAVYTLELATALSLGIVIVTAVFHYISRRKKQPKV